MKLTIPRSLLYLSLILAVGFVIIYDFGDKRSVIMKEFAAITLEYRCPSLSVVEIDPVLRLVEINESHYTGAESSSPGIRLRPTLALMYWDWGMADDAWQLMSNFNPPSGYASDGAADFVLCLGISLKKSDSELARVLSIWSKIDRVGSCFSDDLVNELKSHSFLPAFRELAKMHNRLFDTMDLAGARYILNDNQLNFLRSSIFVLRAYAVLLPADNNGAEEASKLVDRIYSTFSIRSFENPDRWTDTHFQLAYAVCWALYLCDSLNRGYGKSSPEPVARLNNIIRSSPKSVLVVRRFIGPAKRVKP